MRNTGSLLMCVIMGVMGGCTLQEPLQLGDSCPGIKPENVNYTEKDPCADGTCKAANDAISLEYCPEHYRCVSVAGKEPYCRSDCDTAGGEVMCDGDCIHPETDAKHCGASGLCENTKPSSSDYIGENCTEKGKDNNGVYECIDSKCKLTGCGPNFHIDDGECVADTEEACGSVDNQCKTGQRCSFGACTADCGSQLLCDGKCWDTQNDPKHCGALADPEDGHCYHPDRDIDCGEGSDCVAGECKKNRCTDAAYPNICEIQDGERICVNFLNDPENCGNCGVSCETEAAGKEHAILVDSGDICVDGKCQYQCTTENGIEYENCGTVDNPKCVDKQKDNANCGTCGHRCSGETSSCVQGECQANQCDGNLCALLDCTNNVTNCGSECKNCYEETNADSANPSSASCDSDGNCKVESCRAGYRLTNDENGAKKCVPNTNTACGSTNSTTGVLDCTRQSNASSGTCEINTGKCKLVCKSNYHGINDDQQCEADDVNNCGSHGRKCEIANGTMACRSKECVLDSCNVNYHKNAEGNSCRPDTATECGAKRTNCNTISGWKSGNCVSGQCELDSCDNNHYKINGICIANCTRFCQNSNQFGEPGNSYYCCTSGLSCDSMSNSTCKKYTTMVNCQQTIHCTTQRYCDIMKNGGQGGGVTPFDPSIPINKALDITYQTLEECMFTNQYLQY